MMKKLFEKPLVKKTLITLAVLAGVILIFDNIIFPLYVTSAESKVPNVVGLNEDDAVERIKDAGFDPVIADTSFGVSVAVGKIFLQKPAGGKIAKEGRNIYLFVSGGEQSVIVPLLKGKSVLDARFALERIGLKLGVVDEVPSTQPKDMIFDQQFAEGTKLKKGQSVSVSVSTGKGSGNIEVPDLIGKSLTEAKKLLSDSSLSVGKINFQISSTLLPNTVLDQYPAPGNKLNSGDAVDLFVTKEGVIQEKNEYPEEN